MKWHLKSILVFLFSILISTTVYPQELTIYVIPSVLDRQWKNSRELTVTTFINMVLPEKYSKKRYMGHAFVQLKNVQENHLAGSTYAIGVPMKEMVTKGGYGLGILVSDIPGRLETTQQLSYELAERYNEGNISFIRFKISTEMYERLKYYLVEYQKRGYDAIYNGENKPREGKGAGCTAFAVSFLEVAGFLKDFWMEQWMKEVRIPKELVGGKKHNRRVKTIKVLTTGKWAEPDEPHVVCSFYDPNVMHHWIVEQSVKQNDSEVKTLKHNRAIGLEFDFSHKKCPDESVFLNDNLNQMAVTK